MTSVLVGRDRAGCKGCFNFSSTHEWRDEAKRTHRTIFASLACAPAWANGGDHYWYPPINDQDWYPAYLVPSIRSSMLTFQSTFADSIVT